MRIDISNRIGTTSNFGGFRGLLDKFSGAAAGYSLRKLSKSATNAVRVRRSSDNTEQDIGFTGTELDTTTLLDFVNARDVAPADYGAGAAAAYSLRYVSDSYTGSVVRVRRDSDNAEADFNPTEITDGTLLAWVNTDVVKRDDDYSLSDTWSEIGGTDAFNQSIGGRSGLYQYTYSGGATTHQAFQAGNHPDNSLQYKITFDIYFDVAQDCNGFSYLKPDGTSDTQHNLIKGVWHSFTYTTLGGSNLSRFIPSVNGASSTNNDGSGFYLSSFVVEQLTANGYVTTWYDQSGNSNDATQGTAASQPKIVDAGVLVEENGKPAVEFDGTDDGLATSAFAFSASSVSAFVTYKNGSTSGTKNIFRHRPNGALPSLDGYIWEMGFSTTTTQYGINTALDDGSGVIRAASSGQGTQDVNQHIEALIYKSNEILAYQDGSLNETLNTVVGTTPIGAISMTQSLWIGKNFQSNDREYDGLMQELIIFDSDQSSNRGNIEANVNDYYSIYTSTNDGFVTTWYDQAGSNDATQATAASQPQIVDGGSLITENGKASVSFDGVDDNISSSFSVLAQPNTIFSIASTTDLSSLRLLYDDDDGFGGRNTLSVESVGPGNVAAFAGSALFGATWLASIPTMHTVLYNSTLSLIHRNGTQIASGNVGTQGLSGFTIGSRFSGSYWQGNIQEIIIYSSDQSSNRSGIESRINNYYNIY